jgi:hypothetical protein
MSVDSHGMMLTRGYRRTQRKQRIEVNGELILIQESHLTNIIPEKVIPYSEMRVKVEMK